jgi:hypothetical protein
MSTELERRLKSLEAKIATATPCSHPLAILHNPTEDEVDQMYEILNNCPNCRTPRLDTPRIVIFRYPPRNF